MEKLIFVNQLEVFCPHFLENILSFFWIQAWEKVLHIFLQIEIIF